MVQRLMLTSLMGMSLLACSDGDLAGNVGELGEGVFRYECVEQSDARCNESEAVNSATVSADFGVEPEVPAAMAVGGRFSLTYLGDTITDDGELLIVDVEPARKDLVADGGGFTIAVPGTFAFLARNGPKRITTDFVHVEAANVASLDIWHQEQKKSSLTLPLAQEAMVAVTPVSDAGVFLAGSLPTQWTSSDSAILAIGSITSTGMPDAGIEINNDEVRLYAVAEGMAVVTVTQGDVSQELAITVTAGAMP